MVVFFVGVRVFRFGFVVPSHGAVGKSAGASKVVAVLVLVVVDDILRFALWSNIGAGVY